MSFTQRSNDPIYTILSSQLQVIRGGLTISLTDRRGDLISQVTLTEAEGAPSQDELSLIHVYGQLAHQQAPSPLTHLSVERGPFRWFGHRMMVTGDIYDLWIISKNHPVLGSSRAEMELHIQTLEKDLSLILKGESFTRDDQ